MQIRTRALIILTTVNLLNYIDRWIIAAVMPQMSVDLKLSHTQAGFAMSAFMLGYFASSPLFGYLADRYKRTHIISLGTLAWSFSTGLVSLAQNSFQVILSRVAVGVGEASTVSTSQALLSDYYPPHERNKIMAVFTAAIPVGAALGFVLGGLLAHHYGWRNAFLFCALPGIFLAFSVYLFKDPVRGALDHKHAESLKPQGFLEDIKVLIKNKAYMYTVLGYTAFTFTVGGLASWVPQYLVKERGIALIEATSAFGGITVVTGVLGSLFGGWLATKRQRVKKRGDMEFVYWLIFLSLPITVACFFSPSIILFYSLITVSEFLLFATQPTVNVVAMESVSTKMKSTALAFCVFVIHLLGDLISPALVGFFADLSSLNLSILILPVALLPAALFYKKAYIYSRVL